METNGPMDPAGVPGGPRSGPGGTQPVGDAHGGASARQPMPDGQGGYPAPGGYPQGYGQPPYPGHQQPGVGDRAADMMQNVGRHIRTPETKPFYTTSEFLVWLITIAGVVIAGAVVGNGDHGDAMRANLVWILLTAVSIAYIISRGISKAGTRYRDRDRGFQQGDPWGRGY